MDRIKQNDIKTSKTNRRMFESKRKLQNLVITKNID